jgi:hypothetical protein
VGTADLFKLFLPFFPTEINWGRKWREHIRGWVIADGAERSIPEYVFIVLIHLLLISGFSGTLNNETPHLSRVSQLGITHFRGLIRDIYKWARMG